MNLSGVAEWTVEASRPLPGFRSTSETAIEADVGLSVDWSSCARGHEHLRPKLRRFALAPRRATGLMRTVSSAVYRHGMSLYAYLCRDLALRIGIVFVSQGRRSALLP